MGEINCNVTSDSEYKVRVNSDSESSYIHLMIFDQFNKLIIQIKREL